MMKPEKSIYIAFLLITINIQGQTTAKIQNTNISLDNERIIITYDLVDAMPGEKFNVWLKTTDSKGELIQGRSYSGDIGKNIEGGKGLVIYWYYEQDRIELSDEISIQVMAEAIESKKIPYIKALVLSSVYPGWGLAKIEKKSWYGVTGLAGYGALAAGLVYTYNASSSYKDYDKSNSVEERDVLYSDYIRKKNISEGFYWGAAALWIADIAWMTIRFNKPGYKDVACSSWNITFSYNYSIALKTPALSLNFKF
jgi:hypothetical protein